MTDVIDDANASTEMFLAHALKKQKAKTVETPQGTGACLHCAAPLPVDRRWCDGECRNDYVILQNRKRLNGHET